MTFDIHLDLPATITPEEREEIAYDDELDDVLSILRDICSSLQEMGGAQFVLLIGDPVPVSVRRDLRVVIEQLQGILVGIRTEGHAKLDLYEQGIEQRVILTVAEDRVLIVSRDLAGRPRPERKLETSLELLTDQLCELARSFVKVARQRCPERTSHRWFTDWAGQLIEVADWRQILV